MPRAATSKRPDLASRRAARTGGDVDQVGEALMEAMLVVVGEVGYREAAVREVLARCGGHRVQFWERFGSKEECFELAYATWTDRLLTELLTAAAAEQEWQAQLRTGLVALFAFVEASPAVGRALLLEADAAGGATLAKHDAAIDRLGAAIDSVRERVPPEEQPPPLTGVFVAGGVASYVAEVLAAGDPEALWPGLPELVRFAVDAYLGAEAAAAEMAAAQRLIEQRAGRA